MGRKAAKVTLHSIGVPDPYYVAKGFRPLLVRAIKSMKHATTVAEQEELARHKEALRLLDLVIRNRSKLGKNCGGKKAKSPE